MGHKKALFCACGQVHAVDTAQAGSMLHCHCGQKVQVPTLREIAQLPDIESTEERPQTTPRRWTRKQGILFAIGAAAVLLASGIATAIALNRPQKQLPGKAGTVAALDKQLNTLTAEDTLKLWRFYESAPVSMVAIAEKNRVNQKQRRTYTIISWSIGLVGIGIGTVLILFSLRPPKPRHIQKRP
jgi:hypothetical protein